MARVIDGTAISRQLRLEVKKDVADLREKHGSVPGLAVVLAGDDPASAVYVRNKARACDEVGITSYRHLRGEDVAQDDLMRLIDSLNEDPGVDGILVQLPLPKHIDENAVINRILPQKDVDGFHPVNVGKMVAGDEDCFRPCTPLGCQVLINSVVGDTAGKHLVVVGRSNLVGKPIANIMVQKSLHANCIVTICHTAAPDIAYFTRQADILVVAAGRPGMVRGHMVKQGAVVIDVGVNRVADPRDPSKTMLVGDVKFDEVAAVALAITPVPGGVGPMTIAMLLKNTVKAFRLRRGG